jgi:hypothetical protein
VGVWLAWEQDGGWLVREQRAGSLWRGWLVREQAGSLWTVVPICPGYLKLVFQRE